MAVIKSDLIITLKKATEFITKVETNFLKPSFVIYFLLIHVVEQFTDVIDPLGFFKKWFSK